MKRAAGQRVLPAVMVVRNLPLYYPTLMPKGPLIWLKNPTGDRGDILKHGRCDPAFLDGQRRGLYLSPCRRRWEELLKRADLALYTAKNKGKNQTIVYTPILIPRLVT